MSRTPTEQRKSGKVIMPDTIRIIGEEADGWIHLPSPTMANTLCSWFDVLTESLDATEHPATCPTCLQIVAFCKSLKIRKPTRAKI